MQLFAQIVESGSITKAAERLELSKSVVSHHLQALEQHLGVTLLTRTTRRQSLTEAGKGFYQRCAEMNKLMQLAEEEARGSNVELAGTITVTSPHTLMSRLVCPAMCEFIDRHPGIEPRLLANDMRLNLIDKYIDLSVRVGDLPDSSARAVKIGELEQLLCAAPNYLARKGITLPVTEAQLTELDYIANQWEGTKVERRFMVGKDSSLSYRFHSTRVGDSVPTIRMMALAGLGIACLPRLAIEAELSRGALVRLLPGDIGLMAPLWIVHNYGLQMPHRIRAFIDHLKAKADTMAF